MLLATKETVTQCICSVTYFPFIFMRLPLMQFIPEKLLYLYYIFATLLLKGWK